MRDPAVFLWAMVSVLVFFLGVTAVVRLRRNQKQEEQEERLRREQREQLDLQRLEAGTHVKGLDGSVKPKCRYCNEAATQKPFLWDRDESWKDLLRRKFGAPARVRIARDETALAASCAAHDPMAFEEFRIEHTEYETSKAKFESTWETRRARFQREGVNERVKEKIEQHRIKVKGGAKKSRSNVIPLSKAAP